MNAVSRDNHVVQTDVMIKAQLQFHVHSVMTKISGFLKYDDVVKKQNKTGNAVNNHLHQYSTIQ